MFTVENNEHIEEPARFLPGWMSIGRWKNIKIAWNWVFPKKRSNNTVLGQNIVMMLIEVEKFPPQISWQTM